VGLLGAALKAGARRLRDSGSDSIQLVVDYVKQETVDPIKALGKFLAYGTIGAFSMGLGVLFILVAVLRALQEETTVFHGNLSWIPYFIVLLFAAGVLALGVWLVTAGPARPRKRPSTTKEVK
jgi:hypothetical protein